MSARLTMTVARWEFGRYFKWKDQFIGLIVFMVMSALAYGAGKVASAEGRPVTIALSGMTLGDAPEGRLRFEPAAENDSLRLESLRRGEVHAVLSRGEDDTFVLLVEKDPSYRGELKGLIDAAVQTERIAAAGIEPADLARVLTPPALDVRFVDPDAGHATPAEKIAAAVFIGILLLAVFTSMAYILTGITGEKQLRVTESVVAAISPQTWIDGKILGITAYATTTVVHMIVGAALVAIGAKLAWGFTIPPAAVRPTVIVTLVVFSILGLLLWNAFFGAVAATVDDPNTSNRTSLMLLPTLPVIMSLAVIRDPDMIVSRILALFPLTSAPAMPMRLVLGNPGVLEIGASVVLLSGAIWVGRRVAGRIFEMGMLLYGKEPSVAEIRRWFAEPIGAGTTPNPTAR